MKFRERMSEEEEGGKQKKMTIMIMKIDIANMQIMSVSISQKHNQSQSTNIHYQ